MSNGPTVLLVEDNETYRKAVKLALEVSGFTVFEAGNGKDGLSLTKEHKPQVVISDIHMPEMDGITFLTEAKKDPLLVGIPFVMLTNLQEEIDNTVKLGAVEAMLKSSLTPRQVVDICKKYVAIPPDSSPSVA